jgi:type IV secretion system protein VirB9
MSHFRTLSVALLVGILSATTLHAETQPIPSATDTRIRSADYDPEQVYRLSGRVGYQLTLIFAANESFIGLAAGDSEALSFEAQANLLFIKPRATRVTTNLTVLTNQRHYYLDYRVEPQRILPDGSLSGDDPLYALRFHYPTEQAQRAATQLAEGATRQTIQTALATTPAPRNSNFHFCGPHALKPIAVTDDGVRTTFRFGPATELPAIFTRAADGTEALVNFTVTADALVVHRLAPQFILRRGKLVACVVNRGFTGAGQRLATATISPDIIRLAPLAPESAP